jgi:hypothetical protein
MAAYRDAYGRKTLLQIKNVMSLHLKFLPDSVFPSLFEVEILYCFLILFYSFLLLHHKCSAYCPLVLCNTKYCKNLGQHWISIAPAARFTTIIKSGKALIQLLSTWPLWCDPLGPRRNPIIPWVTQLSSTCCNPNVSGNQTFWWLAES